MKKQQPCLAESMSTKKIKDFIASVRLKLDCLPSDQKHLDVLIRVESEKAFNRLRLVLQKYSSDERALNLSLIKFFCELLSERWYYIKHTDACYPHHPKTRANLAYLIVACELCKYINEQVYDILMPTVGAIIHQTSRSNLSCFKLHEFILGDDDTPIEVAKCLDDAVKNKTITLCHTGSDTRPLNENERARLINHSAEASEYYDALQFYIQTGIKNDLDIAQTVLHEALQKDTYGVTATYGNAGRCRLSKAILFFIHNKEELLDVMLQLSKDEWKDFIKDMSYENLSFLILDNRSFIDALQDPATYKLNENYNKAYLFCMTEIFKQKIMQGDLPVNNWLYYFKSATKNYMGNYNKCSQQNANVGRIAAAQAFQMFLVSDLRLDQLNKSPQLAIYKEQLFDSASYLSSIIYQASLLADPVFYFKQHQERNFLKKIFL